MSAESSRAVFLSYASQDAEAARRLCDALRAAGVEVCFDQNERVGGDAWDAKIRRQIAECGLFLPIISANTEARLEGYFRLEWKLAANRTHTMADEKAFLLPIAIDGARDEALLWTQLYDRELEDVFAIQSEVADEVSRILQARDSRGRGSGARFMTKDPRAYDLYLKALDARTGYQESESINESIRLFREALQLDPAFVNAADGLSSAHARMYMEGSDPEERLHHAAEAKRWGETAARLLPGGAGDRALSYYYAVVERGGDRALMLAQNSARAWPNESGDHNTLAIALNGVGRVDEAITEYRIALSLDPLAVVIWQNLINWLSRTRRGPECREAILRCLEISAGREDAGRMALLADPKNSAPL